MTDKDWSIWVLRVLYMQGQEYVLCYLFMLGQDGTARFSDRNASLLRHATDDVTDAC